MPIWGLFGGLWTVSGLSLGCLWAVFLRAKKTLERQSEDLKKTLKDPQSSLYRDQSKVKIDIQVIPSRTSPLSTNSNQSSRK
jgi:hypothetical protein